MIQDQAYKNKKLKICKGQCEAGIMKNEVGNFLIVLI